MTASQACAGGIVHDEFGRLLLVRRGHQPARGSWSVPGGRCRAGESARDACVREVAEETGLQVRVIRLAGHVVRPAGQELNYAIDDFVCAVVGGRLRPGDDADEARWVTRAELDALQLVPALRETLASWDLLPRR